VRYTWNNTGSPHSNWRDKIDNVIPKKSLWTSIDMWQEEGLEHSFDVWEGLFKAPVTGEYRFTIACDDHCTYKMSLDDKLNPANATTLLKRHHWTTYRNKNVLEKSDNEPDL
jgi:hypothetical protein